MELLERPTFESEDSKQIYQHVERGGSVDVDAIGEKLDLPEEDVRDHVDALTAKGYLEERNGDIALAVDVGVEREYDLEDVTYVVRPARNEDFEGLVDTIGAVTDTRIYAVAERLAEELRYDDTVTRHNSVWSRVFFVATVDEYVVGWSHLDLPQVEKLRHTAQLTVGVREDYRGYGIGKRLLQRALNWAEASGYRKVYNSVAETNVNAIAFLESQGWETEAVREDHYTIGDKRVDEVMLAYTF